MGCFLGCFGSKKDRNRRTQKYKVIPRDQQRHVNQNVLGANAFPEQVIRDKPQSPVAELRVKTEEQLNLSNRKKVTFDSNVKTYEHIPVNDSTESLLEKEREENLTPVARSQSQSHSLSGTNSADDSVNSSVRSYPPNHRYQNCQESDDEVDDLDYEDCDFDDEYDDCEDEDNEEEEIYGDEYDEGCNGRIVCQKVWSEAVPVASEESRVDASMETIGTKRYARDRSEYIHPVLNPVENLSQWKAAKAKGVAPRSQKENFSFNLPTPKPLKNQEIAVDASLSNWLPLNEATSNKKAISINGGPETISSEKSLSQESTTTSLRSLEDRPILGVLTVDELRQYSATSSPRKSPCRSPEDMPIIGSVGSYWSTNSSSTKDSGSVSSYKGIPNTTSKYREDKKVTWHSTPFETRLERALNRCSANA